MVGGGIYLFFSYFSKVIVALCVKVLYISRAYLEHHYVKVNSRLFVKICLVTKCFSYQCHMQYLVFVLIFARV